MIVQTVSRLSGQALWIVQTVLRLSEQCLDCPDSFKIIRTVSGLSGQLTNHPPDSFLANSTVLNKYIYSIAKTFLIFAKTFRIAMLPGYHGFSDSGLFLCDLPMSL